MINVGYGNFVASGRMVAVISPESAPVKRLIQEAKEERRLIDATFGKKTRSVIIADSDHVVLSALTPERITKRFADGEEALIMEEGQDERA